MSTSNDDQFHTGLDRAAMQARLEAAELRTIGQLVAQVTTQRSTISSLIDTNANLLDMVVRTNERVARLEREVFELAEVLRQQGQP